MIKADNLFKSYESLNVLKGVSLDIKRGEIVAVVGPSGAGKTTLLQILGSLDRCDSGKIIIDGIDISTLSENELAKFRNTKIGFVFQFHHLLPEFTALENVMMPALIGGVKRERAQTKAEELLKMLSLGERMSHKPSQLSGGEAQRVAVARAIINSPSVLFADEPSGNLDSLNRNELHRIFFELRDKFSLTVVVVTHDDNLAAMADRKIELLDGKIK